MTSACTVRVRGVVQGVGFRPFVFRLARANTLAGWVLNGDEGVEIHLEGDRRAAGARSSASCARRRRRRRASRPSTSTPREPSGLDDFVIRASRPLRPADRRASRPTWRSATRCLRELFDPADPRYRLSLHQLHRLRPALLDHPAGLPYDRGATTMARWPMDERLRARVPRSARAAGSTRSRSRARPAARTTGCATRTSDAGDGDDEADPPGRATCSAAARSWP